MKRDDQPILVPSNTFDIPQKPIATSDAMIEWLRGAARQAREAGNLILAERHEMTARALEIRGPREIATGERRKASINQGKKVVQP